MVKRIGIEALLSWAYREELPKFRAPAPPGGIGEAWRRIGRYGELLAEVDEMDVRNRFGLVAALEDGLPDPDALTVGYAVEALEALSLDLPPDWDPLADLGDLGPDGPAAATRAVQALSTLDREGRRRLKQTPALLVVRHALRRDAPDWRAEPPTARFVCGSNGKRRWFIRDRVWCEDRAGNGFWHEVEVDGYDARRKRPKPGAYQKTFLDPDPIHAAIARAEYEVWRAALDVLVEDLAGWLARFEVEPSDRPFRPWESGERPAPRVLAAGGWREPVSDPVRPLAGEARRKAREGRRRVAAGGP